MITKWKLFNFKSVREETELDIAPLTILAGANSSGKSTVLQSILLVAQTLAHKVSSRSVVLNGALTRLGQFDDLKTADSDADQIVVGWTCRPSPEAYAVRGRARGFRRGAPFYGRRGHQMVSAACEIAFDTDESGDQREVTQIQPRLFSAMLSAITREPGGTDQRYAMTVRRASTADYTEKQRWLEASETDDTLARASMHYQVELDDASLAEIREELVTAEPVGCLLRHFLPERLSLGVDLAAENARVIVATLTGENPRAFARGYHLDRDIVVPGDVVGLVLRFAESTGDKGEAEALRRRLYEHHQQELFESDAVSLESLMENLRRLPPPVRHGIRRELSEMTDLLDRVRAAFTDGPGDELTVLGYRAPEAVVHASWYFDRFFATSVRYLGPLRDEPKSLYPLAPSADPADVGLKGEHTAAVLELHKNRPVRYIPSSAFSADEVSPTTLTRTLATAVGDWLQYLGIAQRVETRDKGKFGHELNVDVSFGGGPHDLTHVGVGVSQVLPLLVASLLAEPDTTLIFEQPELHLHPRVQTLLADFFLSMSQLGKQCIIETHSEYLVNRIRFRTAAAGIQDEDKRKNPWLEATRLYFVERGETGSRFRNVSINEFGAILDWPEGFFDDAEREAEAILRAAAAKRKNRRSKQQ